MSNKAKKPNPDVKKLVTISLTRPIMVEDEETWELMIPERVKGSHMMAMDQADGAFAKQLHLVAALAKIPFPSAKQIDAVDLHETSELGRYLKPFLAPDGTGGESSETSPGSTSGDQEKRQD